MTGHARGTALFCVWNVDLIPSMYVLCVLRLAAYLPCKKILSSRPRNSMSVAILLVTHEKYTSVQRQQSRKDAYLPISSSKIPPENFWKTPQFTLSISGPMSGPSSSSMINAYVACQYLMHISTAAVCHQHPYYSISSAVC